MPDPFTNEALKRAQALATIIWAAIFASLGVYVVVAMVLKDQLPFVTLEPRELSALRLALVVVTGIVLAITPKLYWRTLSGAYGRRDVPDSVAMLMTCSSLTALNKDTLDLNLERISSGQPQKLRNLAPSASGLARII